MPLYSDPDGIWTAYTPVLTQGGVVTATVARARWMRVGNTIIAQGRVSVTGTGTGNTAIDVSLPVPPSATYAYDHPMGTFAVYTGTTGYVLAIAASDGTLLQGLANGSLVALYLGQPGSMVTAALGAGDAVYWSVYYEI